MSCLWTVWILFEIIDPDEEIEGLTVGDIIEVEGRTVPVKQLGE